MTEKRLHYWVLGISIMLCVLMLADAYLSPLKNSTEIVIDARSVKSYYSARGTYHNYHLQTNKYKYDIPSEFYAAVKLGDTIIAQRSAVTSAVQKIIKESDNHLHINIYEIGFARLSGAWMIPAVIIGIIILLFYYTRIDYLQGRSNLTYFFFILTIIMVLTHFSILGFR